MPKFKYLKTTVALGVLSAMSVVAVARVVINAPAQMDNDMAAGEESTSTRAAGQPAVYVRDSGIAVERMNLAERMERLQEWDKSADVYQEIIEKYAGRVVPVRRGKNGQVEQYQSVANVVQEKLAKWPEEGLRVYRDLFGPAAQTMLSGADDSDPTALDRVVARYFITDAGRDAAIRQMTRGFEEGNFDSVTWLGHRLLDWHPGIELQRPTLLFQTALAEQLAGRSERANELSLQLRNNYPQATGVIRGRDAVLATTLDEELKQPQIVERNFRSDSWPMPFGSLDASAVPQEASTGGARVFSFELKQPSETSKSRNADQAQMMAMQMQFSENGNIPLPAEPVGIYPAVVGGELFFQDNSRIYGVDLATGRPLKKWVASLAAREEGSYATSGSPMPAGVPLGLSVGRDRVVALMSQSLYSLYSSEGRPTLVCLDRETGRMIWTADNNALPVPKDQDSLKEGAFSGMPIVVGDSVYVAVSVLRAGQFQECQLVSLSLKTGEYQWSTYVASKPINNMNFDNMGNASTTGVPMLAAADGRIYILTNIGVMACFNASDGRPVWLNVYDTSRPNPQFNRNRRSVVRSASYEQAYTLNPPIIVDGQLFVAPADQDKVFVYSATSGEPIATLPTNFKLGSASQRSSAKMSMLMGVDRNGMALANDNTVVQIPWKKYDTDKSVGENDGMYYTIGDPDDKAENAIHINGRPFMSATRLIVPATDRLYQFDRKSFRQTVYPVKGTWDELEEEPGTVIATPENLIVAGSTRVTVYTDLSVATDKLDRALERDPLSVETHVRYAGLLLGSGRSAEAMHWVDKAMTLLAENNALKSGNARDSLFSVVSDFAVKYQRVDPGSKSAIAALFDRARKLADNPRQQSEYRLAHARTLAINGDFDGQVALYQEVLTNPQWRRASVAGAVGTSTAGLEAEQALTAVVAAHPGVYANANAEAKRQWEALNADATTTAGAYEELSEQYPVAFITPDVLTRAAALYQADDDPRNSNRVIRRLLQKPLSDEGRVAALVSMSRNYMQIPGQVALSVLRMSQAATISGQTKLIEPIRLTADRTIANVTLAEAAEYLRRYRTQLAEASLPTLGRLAQGDDADARAFEPPVSLKNISKIIPSANEVDRADRLIVYTIGDRLAQVKAGESKLLNNGTLLPEAPIAAGFNGEQLIAATSGKIITVNDAGESKWEVSLDGLPAAPVVRPSKEVRTTAGTTVDRNAWRRNAMMIRQRQAIMAQDIEVIEDDNQSAVEVGAEKIVGLKILSDRAIAATSDGRIFAVDSIDGHLLWQTRTSDGPLRHFQATEDFVAFATGTIESSELFTADADTGRVIGVTTYNGLSGQQQQLVNIALSPDGVLVILQAGEIATRDLFAPDKPDSTWPKSNSNKQFNNRNGIAMLPFSLSRSPGSLVINENRVLVVYTAMSPNGNSQSQFVRGFDLRTCEPLKARSGKDEGVASFGATNLGEMNGPPIGLTLSIIASGSSLYTLGRTGVDAYDFDHPEGFWSNKSSEVHPAVDLLLAKDYVLLFNSDDARDANAKSLNSMIISAFSRERIENGMESGVLEAYETVSEPMRIVSTEWKVKDGAIYYVTASSDLVMLKPIKAD